MKEIDDRHKISESARPSRRRFLTALSAAALTVVATRAEKAASVIAEASGDEMAKRQNYSTPPTAASRQEFMRRCTACQLCVDECPQRIVRPSAGQHGLLHISQPYLDFSEGYCLHSCMRCASVCPTDALTLDSLEEKHRSAVGRAVAIHARCLTQTDGVECGACARKCPLSAIVMTLEGPKVSDSVCIGCGKCEHVCPAKPEKAIFVEGL